MPVTRVHKLACYRLPPRLVTAMACNSTKTTLAISRADASIELWDISSNPFVLKTLPPIPKTSVEGLVWARDRLYSTGLQGSVIEFNVEKLTVCNTHPLTGGSGWCIDVDRDETKLIVGTESGYINIFKITSDGIEFEKLTDKQEGRIFCLKIKSDKIVSGSVDAVRLWDLKTGHAILKLDTGRSEIHKETIVWSVAITEDLTIISGDSRGRLTFWDGKIGSQIESFLTHRADILTVTLSDDESTLYCAGVDPLIVSFARVQVKNVNKWVKSVNRKIHDHDVRALILIRDKLYSAGIDGYLAMSSYPPKTLVKYPPLLQNPVVNVCARMVLLRYPTYLELWQIPTIRDTEKKDHFSAPSKKLVLKSKDSEMIVSSGLAPDLKWIIYSTQTRVRVYKLELNDQANLTRLNKIPPEIHDITLIEFFDENQAVLAGKNGILHVISIDEDQEEVIITQTIKIHKSLPGTILHLKINGFYLLAADSSGKIVVYKKSNDSWKFYTCLPKYSNVCVSLSVGFGHLLAAYADQKIVEYDLGEKKFTKFSEELHRTKYRDSLAKHWTVNVAHSSTDPLKVILWDDSTIYTLDKAEFLERKLGGKKKKLSGFDGSDVDRTMLVSFNSKKLYEHIVWFEFLNESEVVVVEANPLMLLEQLPSSLKVKTFGTE